MKLCILTLCVASATAYTFASTDNAVAFANFKKTFNKQYLSDEEHSMRASIFENTLDRIAAKRAAGDLTAGVTKLGSHPRRVQEKVPHVQARRRNAARGRPEGRGAQRHSFRCTHVVRLARQECSHPGERSGPVRIMLGV